MSNNNITLSSRLKNETRSLHDETEERLNAQQLMSSDLSLTAYGEHIATLYKSHTHINNAIKSFFNSDLLVPFLPKEDFTSLLKADLESTKANTEVSEIPKPLTFDSKYEALGALYVINGSTLGRRFIAKKIEPKLSAWSLQGHFYNDNQIKELKWSDYKNKLDHLSLSKEEQDKVLAGAKKCFKAFV